MKQFKYKARDKSGKNVDGVVESVSSNAAARTLQEHGLLVVSLTEKRNFDLKGLNFRFKHVSAQEVATFTRLLATMMKAGLPLVDALVNLETQTKNAYFKEITMSILKDVQGGGSLSSSMERFPDVFSNLYISLVRAGEASGKVDETMEKLADMLEAQIEFKGKVKGAMIYPLIIVVAMGGVGVFMITTIIPRISEVYKEFGAELPLPTQILVSISDFIRNYTVIVVILAVLAVFAYRTLRRNPVSDLLINNAYLKFPVLGEMQVEVTLTILTRTLATLVNSGVPILQSLKIVSQAVDNNYFRLGLQESAAGVEKGLPLSSSIRKNPNFPLIVSQLVAIGEETGTLGESLSRLAHFYQESSERKLKALTTALEPLMILIMGGMVAGLAVAVLLPMFNLVNVIK